MSINCTMFTESQENGLWVKDNTSSWNKKISEEEYRELTSQETIKKLKILGGKVTITRYHDGRVKEIISVFHTKKERGIRTTERCVYRFDYTYKNN